MASSPRPRGAAPPGSRDAAYGRTGSTGIRQAGRPPVRRPRRWAVPTASGRCANLSPISAAADTSRPHPPEVRADDEAALARKARELADAAREAEERADSLRRLRDRAIIQLIEAGWSTRRVGRELGLTATQVSTVWRRSRPARGGGNPGR